jgi:hypothetical protein
MCDHFVRQNQRRFFFSTQHSLPTRKKICFGLVAQKMLQGCFATQPDVTGKNNTTSIKKATGKNHDAKPDLLQAFRLCGRGIPKEPVSDVQWMWRPNFVF